MLLAFGTFGLMYGVWQVLLADLRVACELSPGALGAALTDGFVGSLPAMLLAGRLADRFGAQTLIAVTGLAMAGATKYTQPKEVG